MESSGNEAAMRVSMPPVNPCFEYSNTGHARLAEVDRAGLSSLVGFPDVESRISEEQI